MTKVLMLVDGFPTKHSHANIFIKTQAIALKNAGIDIAILIVDIRSIRRFRRFGFYKEPETEIPTWRISFPWGAFFQKAGQKLAGFLGSRAFKKLLPEFGRPDILHAHFGEVGVIAAKIKKSFDIPLVITEHGSIMLPGNSSDERKKIVLNEAYKKCDALIVVGTTLANNIKALGFKNITVIPNIVPSFFFNKLLRKNNSSKKQFISIGNLLPSKRFDMTIAAFARLTKTVDDISLVIVGTGPEYKNLQKMVADNKIEDKVSFYGFVPNIKLPEIYGESLCFVLPAEYETFGVVYAEALACGIPVIATKCGGPEDIVNSQNGLLITVNDEDALLEALLFMYNNATKYDSDFMTQDIYNRFGEESVIKRILGVYSGVLKNN
jgi:glycosyltransferase involved in cell wall biosynthesis